MSIRLIEGPGQTALAKVHALVVLRNASGAFGGGQLTAALVN